MEVSAKDGTNINELFNSVGEKIINKYEVKNWVARGSIKNERPSMKDRSRHAKEARLSGMPLELSMRKTDAEKEDEDKCCKTC